VITKTHGDHRLFFGEEIVIGRHWMWTTLTKPRAKPVGGHGVGRKETRVATADPEAGTLFWGGTAVGLSGTADSGGSVP